MSHQVQNPGQVVDMPVIEANGILFDFEQCGDPNGEPVLLWMGLGAQRTMWPTVLVQQLASKGFFVTSFDNRDSGLSGHLDNLGTVGLGSFCCIGCYVYCCCLGCNQLLPNPAPYALDDMVTDVVALLDALKLDSVHVVGASMGGMLSQMLCIQHPKRVRSLTSIMSTTGDRWLPSPSAEALVALRSKRPDPRIDMSAYIEATLEVQRVMCGPGNKLDEEYARPFIRLNGERMFYPDGSTRQFAAIVTTPDRTAALRHINIPTAVIHGREDPLVPLEHGLATHASIPGSTMHIIDGMGHNMPSPSWIPIANIIAELAQRASGGRFHATATPSNVNVTLNEC